MSRAAELWNLAKSLALTAAWVWWVVTCADAVGAIQDAYNSACGNRDCPSIHGYTQLLNFAIIAMAIAVPIAFSFIKGRAR